MNYELTASGQKQFLQLQELEEHRLQANENARIYKERTKGGHDKKISPKDIKDGDHVLLYNASLKVILGKLKTKCSLACFCAHLIAERFVETTVRPPSRI